MKYLLALALVLGSTGCRTFDRVVDVIDWTGGAISATADILRASGDDVESVWGTFGLGPEDPASPPAE